MLACMTAHRLAIVLLLLAPACREFTAPEAARTPGAACVQDTDCGAEAVCNNGECDTTHCHVDAQCQSQLCVGSHDGGALGNCGVRECFSNADCGPGFRCTAVALSVTCEPGCQTDADCPAPTICSTYFVNTGSCTGQCRTDADCGQGAYCYKSSGTSLCTQYQLTNCHGDADCPGCFQCSSTTPSVAGVCYGLNTGFDGGVPIVGDRSALSLADNFAPTVTYMEAAFPGAQLDVVDGFGIQADGTIDVSSSTGSATWLLGFALTDGGSVNVAFNGSARKCASIEVEAEAPSDPPISDAVWPNLLMPAEAIAQFTAQPNCTGWAGTSSDSYVAFGSGDGGVRLDLSVKSGDSFFGDGVTGQGSFSCP